MGLFDKIFGSDKIKVQFIDNVNGQTIGVAEMTPDQLPETFSVATTMHIADVDWNVQEAIPPNSVDFIKSKSLILKMRKVEYINPKDILFTLPTISNELPATTSKSSSQDFISMREDDWRQNEFLNKSSFPLVDIEVSKIKDIWTNHSKNVEANFNAFDKCHVRDTIGVPNLGFDLQSLQNVLKTEKIGGIKINDQNVVDGFSLKTEHSTFYGIRNGNKVSQLALTDYTDQTIKEIQAINEAFDLIFANWYHGEIVAE